MMYENKNFISEVSTKVIETRDEFIFQTISSWIVNNHQITVSKETLSKAVALVKMMEDRGVDIYSQSTGKLSDNTYVAGIVNKYKNYFGKSRVVVIKSQLGQPIVAYSGDEVYWKIPKDLPKMTKLMIDGKALYIHRANFQIIDTALLG